MRNNADVPFVKEYSFSAPAFWDILCRCARTARRRAPESRRVTSSGVATTSQREGCVFLDAHGTRSVCRPQPGRARLRRGPRGRQHVSAPSGCTRSPATPRRSSSRSRATCGSASTARRAVAHLLMINDWMTYRLSGELSAEPSNATESMLFDLRRRCWSEEILSTFDIPRGILPPVRRSGERVGALTGGGRGRHRSRRRHAGVRRRRRHTVLAARRRRRSSPARRRRRSARRRRCRPWSGEALFDPQSQPVGRLSRRAGALGDRKQRR